MTIHAATLEPHQDSMKVTLDRTGIGEKAQMFLAIVFVSCFVLFGVHTSSVLRAGFLSDFALLQAALTKALEGGYNYPAGQSISPTSLLFLLPSNFFASGSRGALFSALSMGALTYCVISNRSYFQRGQEDIISRAAPFLILLSAPLLESLVIGQNQALFLAFVLMFFASRLNNPGLAGASLALAACVRYQALAFVPFLLLARNRAVLQAFLPTFLLTHVVSVLLFGFKAWLIYFSNLDKAFATVFLGRNAQSLHSLAEMLHFQPLYSARALQLAAFVAILFAAWLSHSDHRRDVVRLHVIAILSIFLPNAVWYHSYTLAVPAILGLYRCATGNFMRSFLISTLLVLSFDRVGSVFDFSHGVLFRASLLLVVLWGLAMIAGPWRANASGENTQHLDSSAVVRISVSLLVGVFVCYELYKCLMRLAIEKYVFDADSFVYAAVGRALLNGFALYEDIYNNKGPGMAWISAFCMAQPDGIFTCARLQYYVLVVTSCVASYFGIRLSKDIRHDLRLLSSFVLVGLSLLYINYFSAVSIGFQCETFGGCVAIGYVLFIAYNPQCSNLVRHLLLGLLLAGAASIKEPYVLVIISAALLFVRNLKNVIDWIAMPLLYAVLMSMTILFVSSTINGYFNIYLPDAFGNLMWRYDSAPILVRGLGIAKLISFHAHHTPYFGLLTLLMFLCVGLNCVYEEQSMMRRCLRLCTFLMSLYLVGIAISVGSTYWRHHFSMVIPFYIACAHRSMQFLSTTRAPIPLTSILTGAVVALFVLCSSSTPTRSSAQTVDAFRGVVQDAKLVDEILESCGGQTYGFIGAHGRQPYAFTQHSPVGPLFFQIGDTQVATLIEPWINNLASQSVVVVQSKVPERINHEIKFRQRLISILNEHFSTTVPQCAQHLNLDRSGYGFYFKKASPERPVQ